MKNKYLEVFLSREKSNLPTPMQDCSGEFRSLSELLDVYLRGNPTRPLLFEVVHASPISFQGPTKKFNISF